VVVVTVGNVTMVADGTLDCVTLTVNEMDTVGAMVDTWLGIMELVINAMASTSDVDGAREAVSVSTGLYMVVGSNVVLT
jgi:hypothetical protein